MGCSSSKAVLPQSVGGIEMPTAVTLEDPKEMAYVPHQFTKSAAPLPVEKTNTVVVKEPAATPTPPPTLGPGSFVNPVTAAVYAEAKRIGEAAQAAGDPGHKEAARGDELRLRKEFHLAFKNYEYALTMRKSKLGTERHGLIADAYSKMGVCRTEEGYTDLGWKLHMQAMQLRRELFGEVSGPVGESYGYLGDTLVAMNNHRDARCQYERAIEIRAKVGDTTSPQTAEYYGSLGNCHRVMQDFVKALDCLQKARQSFEMFLGPNHDDTINCWFVIALILQEQGQYQEAMPYHMATLKARERIHGTKAVLTSASYMNIGLVQKGLGQLDVAEANLFMSLQIRIQQLGPQHEETAACIANLASLNMARHEYTKAIVLYQRAQQVLEQGVGANHPFTFHVYCKLAECHRAQAQYTQALDFLDKALTVALLVFGTRSKQASVVRISMAQTKLQNLDIEGALQGFQQAYKTDMAIRPQDPSTAKIGLVIKTLESELANK